MGGGEKLKKNMGVEGGGGVLLKIKVGYDSFDMS